VKPTSAHITNASPLWASAAGVKPQGTPWPKDDGCVMCGAPVSVGELAAASDREIFNEAFNNRTDCRHQGEAVCGHCLALWDSEWMQASSKAFAIQGLGVFSLINNPDIAAFVLFPPEAAYVAIFNNRQQAHMIWRTPVALPSPHLQVRVDDDVIQIDRARVLAGVRAWQTCVAILKEVGLPKASPYLLHSVFKLNSELVGSPIERNVKAIEQHSAVGADAVRQLGTLAMADWWALNPLKEVDLDNSASWPQRRTLAQAASDREAAKNAKTSKKD
jgi:CRISPR type IV-associated protein Csf1